MEDPLSRPRDDDLLRERYQDLRAGVGQSGAAPDFRAMLDRAKAEAAKTPALEVEQGGQRLSGRAGRRRVARRAAWASVLAAAALAGILITRGGEDRDAEFDRLVASYVTEMAPERWRSPTSGLLDVPGMELTRSVPSIGGSIRGLDPASAIEPPPPEGREERL